jgi:transcriptional regulator with XRE-family HTH domain
MEDIGVVLALLRRRRRWSIRTLARRSGVAAHTIARLETDGGALDADAGGRLVQAIVANDPTLYAMALLCCHTFHAEVARRDAWCQLAHTPVAGCA